MGAVSGDTWPVASLSIMSVFNHPHFSSESLLKSLVSTTSTTPAIGYVVVNYNDTISNTGDYYSEPPR